MANKQQQLNRILELLGKLDTDLRQTNQDIKETNQRVEETNRKVEQTNRRIEETNQRVEKWDERYFTLVKDQGVTARTIIVAAASVVVLSPVLGAVSDLFTNHFFK